MQEKNNNELDAFDLRILDILSGRGRISITDLAKEIGLSKSPTQARVKQLEATGVISGYRADVDPIALGRDHVAFVEVKLSDTREAALAAFNAQITQIPEIEECHMLAAHFDYLLKVRTQDMRDFRRVLGEAISALPHVAQSSTHVVMQAIKDVGHPIRL